MEMTNETLRLGPNESAWRLGEVGLFLTENGFVRLLTNRLTSNMDVIFDEDELGVVERISPEKHLHLWVHPGSGRKIAILEENYGLASESTLTVLGEISELHADPYRSEHHSKRYASSFESP